MAARALTLWKKHEQEWKQRMLYRTGVLWMAASGEDSFERGSVEMLRLQRSSMKNFPPNR